MTPTFSELFKKYKNEVTNQDQEEWLQNADYAAEELRDMLNEYVQNKDADQRMSAIIQALNEFFMYHDEKYNQRQESRKRTDNNFKDARRPGYGGAFDVNVKDRISEFE